MPHLSQRIQIFKSLPFIVALVLLLLNDFYFKAAFANIWTGKISDVAGLFLFPIFWSTLFPKRRTEIYLLTFLTFIWWKSPFSQAFIEFFSNYIYPIERVVDVTDLLALLVLPLAYFYEKCRVKFEIKLSPYLVAGVSIFAFCATSMPQNFKEVERPKYALFDIFPLSSEQNYARDCGYLKTHVDTINNHYILIQLQELTLSDELFEHYEDDYTYVKYFKNLPNHILCPYENNDSIRQQLIKNFLTKDSIQITGYQTLNGLENLNFHNGLLDGKYQKIRPDSILWIDGFYQGGIEVDTWKYYDKSGNLEKEIFFKAGERVKEDSLMNEKLYHSETFQTRQQTIKQHDWALIVLITIQIILFYLFIQNQKNIIDENKWNWKSGFLNLGLSILSVLLLFALYLVCISFVPVLARATNFFRIIGAFIFIVLPVFIVIFQAIPLKNLWTVILIILISLVFLFLLNQIFFLNELSVN